MLIFIIRRKIFDNKLKEIFNLDKAKKLPNTFSAIIENEIFYSVSPEIYRSNFPQGIEEASFEKLITHEIAHHLHIRILNGNEDAMGPIWFYEGFAIYTAEQFIDQKISLDLDEIIDLIKSKKRGDYRKYGHIFRLLLKYYSLKELLKLAITADFNNIIVDKIKKTT